MINSHVLISFSKKKGMLVLVKIILTLPPLHIYIEGEAKAVTERLSKLHETDYQRLAKELKGMSSDAMMPKYIFTEN